MENEYDSLAARCAQEFNSLSEGARRTRIVVDGGTEWERFLFAFSLVPKVDVFVVTRDACPRSNGEYVIDVEEHLPKYQAAS